MELIIEGLKCPEGSGVMYVAPTQGQARVIIWNVIMEIGREVIKVFMVWSISIGINYQRTNDIMSWLNGVNGKPHQF